MGRFTEFLDEPTPQRPNAAAIAQTTQYDPDTAAQAQDMAKATGLPVPVVATQLPALNAQRDVGRFAQFVHENPEVDSLGVAFAQVARDDVDILDRLRITAKNLGAGAVSLAGGGAGIMRSVEEGFDVAENVLRGTSDALLGTSLGPNENSRFKQTAEFFAGIQRDATSTAEKLTAENSKLSLFEQGVFGGVQALATNLPLLAGAVIAKNPQMALTAMTGIVFGNEYSRAREEGLGVGQSILFGGTHALIENWTERLPVGMLLGDIAKKSGLLKTIGRQMAAEIPGEQIATLLQDFTDFAVLRPEATLQDYLSERPGAAYQTLVATVVASGAQSAIVHSIGTRLGGDSARANANAEVIKELGQLSEASKLRERSPEQFKRYIEQIAPDAELYIDAADMEGLDQSVLDELPDDISERIAEAEEADAPVRITAAEYATYFADAHTAQYLSGRIRVGDASAMNVEEANNIESEFAERAERVMAEAEDGEQLRIEARQINEQVKSQIISSGRFRADVASGYATIVENFFVTMSARAGMSPGEMFAQFPLRVQAVSETPAAEALGQLPPEAFSIQPHGDIGFELAVSDPATGKKAGYMEVDAIGDDVAQVRIANVNASIRGQGVGQQLVAKAYEEAQAQGRRLVSDRAVSAQQLRVYEALRRRGWTIEYSDPAQVQRVLEQAEAFERQGEDLGQIGASAPLGGAVVTRIAPPAAATIDPANLQPVAMLADTAGELPAGHTRFRHFGNFIVPTIDPEFMGTGMRGEEGRRAGPRVTSLYPDTGFTPESGVGPIEYVVDIPTERLYDANADPLKLAEQAQEATSFKLDPATGERTPTNTRLDMDAFEHLIKDAGYAGYTTPTARDENLRGQARVFVKLPVIGARVSAVEQTADLFQREEAAGTNDDAPLAGLPESSPGPILAIREAARRYVEDVLVNKPNLPPQTRYAKSDVARSTRIAAAYEAAVHDPNDFEVQIAYDALINETLAQYQVVKELGIDIEFIEPGMVDPYEGGPREVLADLARGHLWVFPTDSGFGQTEAPDNPLLAPTAETIGDRVLLANDVFRIVHDVFGHGKEGVGFGPVGEENAWHSHVRMYSPLAARAMTSETRGQNTWVNYGPHGEANRASQKQTVYAEQKATLLPDEIAFEGVDEVSDELNQDDQERGADYETRGQIMMGRDLQLGSVVTLFENADLSTFLHESGHFFFEIMADLAARPNAPAAIRADTQTLLDWVGYEGTIEEWRALDIPARRKAHEQFARGFEAWLFEGRAPSEALRPLFHRFRSWLIATYKVISRLNVTLADEVRTVMAGMVASQESIAAAEAARNYAPLFDSQEQSGMSDDGYARYRDEVATATQRAEDQLQVRSLRNVRWLDNARSKAMKKMQAENKAKRADVEQEVSDEIAREPVRVAETFILTGKAWVENLADGTPEEITVDGPHKLSRAALEAAYGTREEHRQMAEAAGLDPSLTRAPWQELPRSMLAAEGLSADEVAEMTGFTSGDQLITELLALEPRAQLISQLTDRRMMERYGDLNNEQTLKRAVDIAVHNQHRTRVVATELAALDETLTGQPGGINAVRRAAREYAARVVQRKKVRDVRPSQFTAAETKAARDAQRALAAGDLKLASARKRDQMFNGYASRDASRAMDNVEKWLRYLRKFNNETTRRALDPGYRDQIDKLLERFDIRKRPLREVDKRTALAAWVKEQEAAGNDPLIPDELLDEARRTSYQNLTVEEFAGLVDSVKNIAHLARMKRRLLASKDQRDFDTAVAEITDSIDDNAIPGKSKQQLEKDLSLWGRFAETLSEWLTHLRKMSSVARQIDGGKDGGKFWEYMVRPLNAAADKEVAMRADATKRLNALLDSLPALRQNFAVRTGQKIKGPAKTYVPEIGASLSLEARLSVALNWGNEGNRERVMAGNRWTESQAQAVVDTLTKAEMDFVQAAWDFIGSYWSEIAAKEERVTGVHPLRVDPTPVNTKHGQYRGGYYPIVADPGRSDKAAQQNDAELISQSLRGAVSRATTRRGHTKARVGGKDPVRLDLGVITQHIGQVAHDLAWHEALIDAGRLLRDSRVSGALREHYGAEVTRLVRKTLDDVARGEVVAQDAGERVANYFRIGTTVAGLGLSMTTSLLQFTGVTQSIVRVGYAPMARGIMEFAARPMESIKKVREASTFMRDRGLVLNRELSEITNRLGAQKSNLTNFYFFPIQALQTSVDIPTWLAAYGKAAGEGEQHELAISIADQAVRDSQSSGQMQDLAEAQRGGAWKKLWTNFYSYFSATYNLSAESIRGFKRKPSIASGAKLAADFVMLYTVPAALGLIIREGLRGDFDDADEDELAEALLRAQLSAMLGVFPYVRELGGVIEGFDYRGPAGASILAQLGDVATQVGQGEVDESMLRAVNRAAGTAFHYPAAQVDRTVRGMIAVSEGEAGPQAILLGPPYKE
jgi:predicted GNAT family acetyltransferase